MTINLADVSAITAPTHFAAAAGPLPSDAIGMSTLAVLRKALADPASIVVAASDAADWEKDWAAFVCDGTDDHVQVAAAIDALPSTGGVIRFTSGTFRGRFALDADNVSFVGTGPGTVLKAPDGLGSTPYQTLTITGNGTSVFRLMVHGNRSGAGELTEDPANSHRQSDGIGIYANNVTVSHCWITESIAHGIIVWHEATSEHEGAPNASADLGPRENIWITNNYLFNTGSSIQIRATIDIATSPTSSYAVIAFNILDGMAADGGYGVGITLHSGSNALIMGNIVRNMIVRCMQAHTLSHNSRWIGNQCDGRFHIRNGATGVTAIGNNWEISDSAVLRAIWFEEGTAGPVDGFSIIGGTIKTTEAFAAFRAIEFTGPGNETPGVTAKNGIISGVTFDLGAAGSNRCVCMVRGNAAPENIFIIDPILAANYLLVRNIDDPLSDETGIHVRSSSRSLTINSGTATVANGNTTVAVTHGLARTPTAKDISVTPTLWSNASKFWITAVGATTFTINVDADPGAGTATFVWQANIL